MTSTDPLLGLLQFADGLFPAGGYAHSFGLESYAQAGRIADRGDVEAFCRAYLLGSAGPCDAAAVVLARRLGAQPGWAELGALDELLEAMKPVAESRQASRQMGRQTMRIAAQVVADPLLQESWVRLEAGRLLGHHPLVFGLVAAALDWQPRQAALAYLYSTAALLVNAALRLLPLGQLDGQRTLFALTPTIDTLATSAAESRSEADLWSFCPGIDVGGLRHATLNARLFRS